MSDKAVMVVCRTSGYCGGAPPVRLRRPLTPQDIAGLQRELDRLHDAVDRAMAARGYVPRDIDLFLEPNGGLVGIRRQRPSERQYAECSDYIRLSPEERREIERELSELRDGFNAAPVIEQMNRRARMGDLRRRQSF
jgi:hypothetical protein